MGRVNQTCRLFQMIRARILIQRVGGDTGPGHPFLGVTWLNGEMVFVKRSDHTVATETRLRHLRTAFDDFSQMPCEPGIGPSHQRDSCIDRSIAGAAGNDHIGAILERFLKRLRPHHCDDSMRALDLVLGKFADRPQRRDLTCPRFGFQRILRLLAPNHRDFRMKSFLRGNLPYDFHQPINMRVTTTTASGTDEDGHSLLGTPFHHQRQIPLRRRARNERLSGAKIIRPWVHRPGVRRNQIEIHLKGALDRFLSIAVAKHARCRKHSYRFHLCSPALRFYQHKHKYLSFRTRPSATARTVILL